MLNEVTDEVTKPASGISPLKKDIEALNERVTEVENDLTLYKEHQAEVTNTVVLNSTEVHSKSIDADTASFGSETVSSLEAGNATINNANINSINGTVGIDKAIIGELELTHPELERLDVGSLHAGELDTEHLAINELTVNTIASDVVMQDVSMGDLNVKEVTAEDIETLSLETGSIHNDGNLTTGNAIVNGDIEVGDRVSARDVQADQAEVDILDVMTIKNSKNTRNEKSFINLSPALQTVDDFYVVKVPNTKGLVQLEASDGCWNMTVIKNGKNVIVAYSEETLDKIPAIRYTENGDVYFSIKCDGQINYVFDVNDVSDTPELDITYTYDEWPEEGTDFVPTALQHTVIMGNNTVECGLTVMGQLDYKIGPEEVEAFINNLNLKGMLRFVNSEGITEEGSQGYYVSSDANGEPHWTEPSDASPDSEGEVVLSTADARLITERKLALWNGKSYYGREIVNNITKLGEVTEGTWKAGDIDTPELTADVARVEEIFSPLANIDVVEAESVLTDDINGVIDFTTEKGAVVIRENVEVTGDLTVDGTVNATAEKAIKDSNGEVITATYARLDSVGAANGIATLDGNGKLPLSQLPTEAIVFKGMWNASTNTPRLVDGTGTSGDYYIVSVGGTVNFGSGNITFVAGDGVIYDGSKWHRKADTNLVQSVNGATGNVSVKQVYPYTNTTVAFGSNLSIPSNFWTTAGASSGVSSFLCTVGGKAATGLMMAGSRRSVLVTLVQAGESVTVYSAKEGDTVLTKMFPVDIPELPYAEITYATYLQMKSAGTLNPNTVYLVGI